jgi:glycoside/pentoside/hexuronide:cation symporter, GPH family
VLFLGFFNFAYSKFFLNDLRLEPRYWYIGLAIYGFINAINDPIFGFISDNTDARKWGSRRLIYIKWGAPLLSLAFLLIWWIPADPNAQFLLFLHFFLTLCFFDTMMTMVVMAWMSLLPDMTTDIDQRTRINFIGFIVVFVFGLPLLGVSTLGHEQIKIASLLIALVSPVAYFLVVKFSKEKPEFHHDAHVPFKQAVKLTLWNRAHLCVIGLNFIGQLSSTMTSAFTFMFWYIIGQQNILWYFLCTTVIGYGSNIIAMKLREKVGMINLMILYGLLQVVGGMTVFFLVMDPAKEPLIWIGIVWVSFFGGATVFKGAMHMLVIDADELNSGQRREGMYYGMNALLVKPAESLGPAIGTAIMFAFAYIQGAPAESQPASVFTGIKIVFLLIPQITTLISMLILWIYPLRGKRLMELENRLEEKHRQKKEALAATGAAYGG